MSEFKVKTTYIHPPIPSRSYDYCAYFDGEEEGGVVGWGRTMTEAVEDLQMIVDLWDLPEPERAERAAALVAFATKTKSPADERERRGD